MLIRYALHVKNCRQTPTFKETAKVIDFFKGFICLLFRKIT